MRRFFRQAADVLGTDHPVVAEKLRRASPHWTRHTHATHALARGAELTTVRDNLRHASIATTSIYLQSDEGQTGSPDGYRVQSAIASRPASTQCPGSTHSSQTNFS